jgi:uncharacterized lipoprotein YbaY
MPSEQMQALTDALREHLPQGESLTVQQHRAMHEAAPSRQAGEQNVRTRDHSPGRTTGIRRH